MRGYIRTIEDLERLYYSAEGARYIAKADAPVLSTTTGVYKPIYGAQVWRQLNQADNAFGLLPKVPWIRSGWRVITARASSSVTGGVAENGAIPDSIKPSFQEVSTKPKTVAHVFNVSEVQQFLAKESNDDAIGDLEFMRGYMAIEHKEQIDRMLLTDVDTLAGNNFESIDRVVSSYSEVSDATIGLDAGDADIYSIDRDTAASWADAYVNHNSGTDRALTDELIRTLLQNVYTNGGHPTLFLTGYDTYSAIQGLYNDQARYNQPMAQFKVKVGVNGVETAEGTQVGINVATLYGIPIFTDPHVPKDTISRLYLLDTSNPENFDIPRLCFKVAKPTQYFEAGMSSGDPFGINKLADEGMYRTMGELICTFFAAQGKIRDLM